MNKNRHILINLFGILLALGIALGGALGVQTRLAEEQSEMLQGGGAVRVLVSAESLESAAVDSETMPVNLTEEELLTAVLDRDSGKEPSLHEPGPGQLTMAQALEYGKTWTEDFFLPRLGMSSSPLSEYKASCRLWSLQEEESGTPSAVSVSDYWSVEIVSPGIEAQLILNAASGQILDASVICSFPAEYRSRENLMSLLADYSDSFGLYDEYFLIGGTDDSAGDDGQILYQSIGSRGLFSALNVSDIVISRAASPNDTRITEYTEFFMVRLYLRYGAAVP